MARPRLGITLAAAVLLLAGCAQQESSAGDFQGAEADVAQVIEDFESAAGQGDAEEICSRILARELASELGAGGSQCVPEMDKAVGDVNDFELDVTDVTVAGATARAAVRQGDEGQTVTFELERDGDAWRVTSFGA